MPRAKAQPKADASPTPKAKPATATVRATVNIPEAIVTGSNDDLGRIERGATIEVTASVAKRLGELGYAEPA